MDLHVMEGYRYAILPGFFHEGPTTPEQSQAVMPVCGSWTVLKNQLKALRIEHPRSQIKLLLLTRHGEHNALCEKLVPATLGLSAADHLERSRRSTTNSRSNQVGREWPLFDPSLSAAGTKQVNQLGVTVRQQVERGMPVPKHYVSPARRAVQTWAGVWSNVGEGEVSATVIEELREELHVHLCNARRNVSLLQAELSQLVIPADTSEVDPLWQPSSDCRYDRADAPLPPQLLERPMRGMENGREMALRAEKALNRIMDDSGESACKSVTSHCSLLREMMGVLGSLRRDLRTGEMCAVVVKVD
ncbi:uncharacterized protein MKK02DRAFT_28565 [Dioszegia hungarica]|uniref:Uncharacterized protein n=1 Tax=Dioszegia hungarica TaxID=4972 RepID=A0AA38H6Y4_9TREE|nr:uncharacterized protein MKK02DRAFT_28565 [Dioszegia hungarica]KAI9633799.1 hypothetical protein MKK02DRAFT_28565 [Dioszegia hungarica]